MRSLPYLCVSSTSTIICLRQCCPVIIYATAHPTLSLETYGRLFDQTSIFHKKISFTHYPAYSRIGREKVPNFPSNSGYSLLILKILYNVKTTPPINHRVIRGSYEKYSSLIKHSYNNYYRLQCRYITRLESISITIRNSGVW